MRPFFSFICLVLFSCTVANAQTATIGKYTWSLKNLDVKTFRNGDKIKQCQSPGDWLTACQSRTPAWCYYCIPGQPQYGVLYNGWAVTDPRGLAPVGWHIPSQAEFNNLFDAVGGEMLAGGALKSKDKWIPYSPGTAAGGSNDYNFNWEPSGFRYGRTGTCVAVGYKGYFWTSYTSSDEKDGYAYWASTAEAWINSQDISKNFGLSVRCVVDTP